MPVATNRRIVLAARPTGEPKDSDFRLEESPIPSPAAGEVLLRALYLSLDPYMRGRMNAAKSYAAPVEIGQVMEGGTISEVVESRSPDFSQGDIVLGYCGWQEYCVCGTGGLRKIDPALGPVSYALGVLGMPGLTAYTGLLNIGQPKEGETLVVAAAAGAVGSVVGQIAKIKGCRAVGVAGGKEKCEYVRRELGFDECIDHRSETLGRDLKAACPNGIDIYFENVGGEVLRAVIPLLNMFARVPVCGLIAHYNATGLPPGPDRTPQLMSAILTRRVTVRGFIVSDYSSQYPDFVRDVGAWLRAGRIKFREDIVEGLDNAVSAFQGLLRGRNLGKLLVHVNTSAA
jgi:NADPH-dependent curcumin reductase CurA